MPTRRRFLQMAAASTAGPRSSSAVNGSAPRHHRHVACLVDTTLCLGCRKCEEACRRANGRPRARTRVDDRTALAPPERRPTPTELTVVNAYPGAPSRDQSRRRETTVKVQCMHCLDPACVSACIVGALTKGDEGEVRYDPRICLGCRYCMVACPFGVPAYEYASPVKPRVVKCEFCANTGRGPRANPACAEVCPVEALVFGRRGELIQMARERIAERPARYLDIVYGEHEVGGTSWLYLVGRRPTEIGLIPLPRRAPPRLTEKIQHAIFRYGAIPVAIYSALGALMWLSRRRASTRTPSDP